MDQSKTNSLSTITDSEELAVLEFLSKEKNAAIALSIGDFLDTLRSDLNNQFWLAAYNKLKLYLEENRLPWIVELTEDKNVDKSLVGLHLQPTFDQSILLFPFMEQQFVGDSYRIFHGLMWNVEADPVAQSLEELDILRKELEPLGFSHSPRFHVWQWLPWHPRRKDFLIQFAQDRDNLLNEMIGVWKRLLVTYGPQLENANARLRELQATPGKGRKIPIKSA